MDTFTNIMQKLFGKNLLGLPLSVILIYYVINSSPVHIMKCYIFLVCIGACLISLIVMIQSLKEYNKLKDLFWISTTVFFVFSIALYVLKQIVKFNE